MNKLGYIISDRKISDLRDFVGNVKDISQADSTKPLLYIGYKNAKKVKGYKNILEKKIDDKTFWTFKKTESRSDYEIDLENGDYIRTRSIDEYNEITQNAFKESIEKYENEGITKCSESVDEYFERMVRENA